MGAQPPFPKTLLPFCEPECAIARKPVTFQAACYILHLLPVADPDCIESI